jgi:hypothetical protein
MTPAIEAAIRQAAAARGINPAFALAVAERESNGDPNARASQTIEGLFQMSAPLRAQYGIGNSTDPSVQADGWTRFIGDTGNQLAQRLGRKPTDPELYLAHYFGEGRAARIISGQIAPNADVRDVFTPQELAQNPEIARAGNVGRLVNNIAGDISHREAEWGDGAASAPTDGVDFSRFGQLAGNVDLKVNSQPIDFASFGTAPSGNKPAPTPATDPTAALADIRLDNLNSAYGSGGAPSTMDLVRARAAQSDAGFDPQNVSAPIVPGTALPDEEFGGENMRPIRGVMNTPGTEIDLSQLGLTPSQPQVTT